MATLWTYIGWGLLLAFFWTVWRGPRRVAGALAVALIAYSVVGIVRLVLPLLR
jgi:hypothetical protein